MIARRAIYAGRVQGVGFRFSTKQIATGFEVVGWVKNLADGTVELRIKGEPEEVDEFLLEIRENSSLAHYIQDCDEGDIPLADLDGVTGFSITR